MIKLEKINDSNYKLIANKDIFFGNFIMMEDGYFSWFPIEFKGTCISSYTLKEIAEKLDELNKDWDNHLNLTFKK